MIFPQIIFDIQVKMFEKSQGVTALDRIKCRLVLVT